MPSRAPRRGSITLLQWFRSASSQQTTPLSLRSTEAKCWASLQIKFERIGSDPVAASFRPVARLLDDGLISHLLLIVCDKTTHSLEPEQSKLSEETTPGSGLVARGRIGSVGVGSSGSVNEDPRVRDL